MQASMISLLAGASALLATAGAASAHDMADIDRTMAYQLRQIEFHRATGRLTRREQEQLVAHQAHIAEMKVRARADGVVTAREHRAIRAEQHAASQHIAALSTNGRINLWRRLMSAHLDR